MAAEAARNGKTVALVERDLVGGTCLNRGCIPTKALCRNAEVVAQLAEADKWGINIDGCRIDWQAATDRMHHVVNQLRDGVKNLLASSGVTLIEGEARFITSNSVIVGDTTLTGDDIVIATGSRPRQLPIEGAELAIDSDYLFTMTTLPASLCIVGGGVIGIELAGILNAYGVNVTVVEYCKEILPPFDKDIAKRLRSSMSRRGIGFVVGAAVQRISRENDLLQVTYEQRGKQAVVEAEKVLMAVGRAPVLPNGLEDVGVTVTPRGITVDDRMGTNVNHIWAIGDVNGRCMLAHAATAQGRMALSAIEGKPTPVNLDIVPSAVFTTPEAAMVGLTDEQASENGHDIVVKKIPVRSNGKALAMDEPDGLAKIIVDRASRRIVGCHLLCAHAADLIQEVALAMTSSLTIDHIANTIHGHPTLSEIISTLAQQFNQE